MTIATTVPVVSYAGNGSTVGFNYTWKVFEDTALKVYLQNVATGVLIAQVLNTDYSVTNVGVGTGGQVIINTPPATGYNVVIFLDPTITQPTDLKNGGDYNPVTVENSLDRRNMIEQANAFKVTKCLKVPDGEVPAATDMTLPSIIDRKGKTLIFDINGKPIAGSASTEPVVTGTFTPFLRGSSVAGTPTYVNNVGKYTKIGKLVFITGFIEINAKTGIAGFAQISQLPFPMSVDSFFKNPIQIIPTKGITFTSAGAQQIVGYIDPGLSIISIATLISGGNIQQINITDFLAASAFSFSGCYMADS